MGKCAVHIVGQCQRWVILVATGTALLSSGCTVNTYPCPENGTSLVYDTKTYKALPANPLQMGGSKNQYDDNGRIKGKKSYTHKGVK